MELQRSENSFFIAYFKVPLQEIFIWFPNCLKNRIGIHVAGYPSVIIKG